MNRKTILSLLVILLVLSGCSSRYGYLPRGRAKHYVEHKSERKTSRKVDQKLTRISSVTPEQAYAEGLKCEGKATVAEKEIATVKYRKPMSIDWKVYKPKELSKRSDIMPIDSLSPEDDLERKEIRRTRIQRFGIFATLLGLNASIFYLASGLLGMFFGIFAIIASLSMLLMFVAEPDNWLFETNREYRKKKKKNGGVLLLAWLLVFISIILILFSIAVGVIGIFFFAFIALLVGLALFVSADNKGGSAPPPRVKRFEI